MEENFQFPSDPWFEMCTFRDRAFEYETKRSRMEKKGMEKKGMEKKGMEKKGMEKTKGEED